MRPIDINCDMGEGLDKDESLMPFIDSSNIACGYHAGDEQTMRRTVRLCILHNVHIGAHPSFPDRANFGRSFMEVSPQQLYGWIIDQLARLQTIATKEGAVLHHVKPHGALYNKAAMDPELSIQIAKAIKDFNKQLILYGLSGTCLIREAEKAGLKTLNEVFADRTYQKDGTLTPRNLPGALITENSQMLAQCLQMFRSGTVTALSGETIGIKAETICIHGDGIHAVEFARSLNLALK